jgi:virulence factor Mce-like protein
VRRLLVTALLAPALAGLVALGLGARDGGEAGYRVRAIFDNAAAAVPGEDVKVAGAKAGAIESMDVTADKKAAVTLRIDDARFAPFRSDAHCIVRPQSLIGEKFVDCTPGTPDGRPLERIERGDGEGEHLLPVSRTSSPVDLDLVNDTLRLPYRERLAIVIDELGTGLAGRGAELNAVIHRANPALRETDRVLAILARQNRVLGRLAEDSDAVLAPLARERERVADFVVRANATAGATAERRADLRASIARLPGFLRQLRPLMADLGGFADQATPVTRDLRAAAPGVDRLIATLGPFSRAARPAIRTLGRATLRGRPALLRARPLIRRLIGFAADADPLSRDLEALTRSLDRTGAIERAMDYLFFQMSAINGFDSAGHYLRAGLLVNLCAAYATSPQPGCSANFVRGESASAGPSVLAARTSPARRSGSGRAGRAGGEGRGSVPPLRGGLRGLRRLREDPRAVRQRERSLRRLRRQAAQPSPGLRGEDEPMLDYLLGADR